MSKCRCRYLIRKKGVMERAENQEKKRSDLSKKHKKTKILSGRDARSYKKPSY